MHTTVVSSFHQLIQALNAEGVSRSDRNRRRPGVDDVLAVLDSGQTIEGSVALDALVPVLTSTWYSPKGLFLTSAGHVLIGGAHSLRRELLIHHRLVDEPGYLQLFALDPHAGPWAIVLGKSRHLLWVDLPPNAAPWQGPDPLTS